MNEREWLTSDDPVRMLKHLLAPNYQHLGRVSDGPFRGAEVSFAPSSKQISNRKLRLFACACCRQVWDQLADPRSRKAVEVAERYADAQATATELLQAHEDTRYTVHAGGKPEPAWAARWIAFPELEQTMRHALVNLFRVPPALQAALQAALLRDLVGNPWRRTSPQWQCVTCGGKNTHRFSGGLGCADCYPKQGFGVERSEPWLAPTVLAIARRAYDERDFTALPVLADALEEAGCDNEDILLHLRPPCKICGGDGKQWMTTNVWPKPHDGPLPCGHCNETGIESALHVRGCWALDLILGKE